MNKDSKIYVAGHRGMVGSAIVRKLAQEGFHNLVLRTSKEMDLRNQQQVHSFFHEEQPDYVFLAAAKVGGIQANNTYRGEFIYENLMIQNNVIHASYLNGVKKLAFLGSSCIYPKKAPQPMKEEHLLTGPLEHTNEPYAVAKIAGIKMCQAYHDQYGCHFISLMPTNLYGPHDNYDLETSHVLPALLRKMHDAKIQGQPSVEIWGSGQPMREFLHADDLGDACYFLMQNYNDPGIINIGTGKDISIAELASLIQEVVGYEGELMYNTDMPDGTPRKLLDVSKMNELGWRHTISLREGIERAYESMKQEVYADELYS
jgi:GDP-L-fucose synthase